MSFIQKKEEIDKELKQFVLLLNEVLPTYSKLLKKASLGDEEVTLLGDIEYYLIELNAKIAQIKNGLDEDLFGHSIDLYYRIKAKALSGDPESIVRVARMKNMYFDTLQNRENSRWN